MHLTPTERDRLLLFSAAELARRRLAAGVLLNVPEATALIADAVCEVARAGGRHAEAVAAGRSTLGVADVMVEVPHIVTRVAVEAVFADGSRLVVVDEPFGPVPVQADSPGAVVAMERPEVAGSAAIRLAVENTASVPISVTSHFHFFEANPRLRFDRSAAFGMHLNIPAGAHVRFEPGISHDVELIAIRGNRVVIGFSGLVDGPLDSPGAREAAVARARACGFLDTENRHDDDRAQAEDAVGHLMRAPRSEVAQ
jgi:urease subunit gamma/beta